MVNSIKHSVDEFLPYDLEPEEDPKDWTNKTIHFRSSHGFGKHPKSLRVRVTVHSQTAAKPSVPKLPSTPRLASIPKLPHLPAVNPKFGCEPEVLLSSEPVSGSSEPTPSEGSQSELVSTFGSLSESFSEPDFGHQILRTRLMSLYLPNLTYELDRLSCKCFVPVHRRIA